MSRHYCWLNILIYIVLCIVLVETVNATTAVTNSDIKLTKSNAENVCRNVWDYNIDLSVNSETCQKNFLSEEYLQDQPSKLHLGCQKEEVAYLQVIPAKSVPQIIMLIPKMSKQTSKHLEENSSLQQFQIEFYIALENKETVEIFFNSNTVYNTWISVLDNTGHHSRWMQGPTIIPYVTKHLKNPYKIDYKIQSPISRDNDYFFTAVFTWDILDETDSCFNIVNTCESPRILGNIFHQNIGPVNNRTMSAQVDGLLLNDTCRFNVSGKYGESELKYRVLDDPRAFNRSQGAQNIVILTKLMENTSGVWQVNVNWSTPPFQPDYYKVTLWFANKETKNLTVQGNATEAVFADVHAGTASRFSVTIVTVAGNTGQVITKTAMFGKVTRSAVDVEGGGGAERTAPGSGRGARATGVAAAGAALACAGAVLAAALCARRYRDRKPRMPLQEQEKEESEEYFMSSERQISGNEDTWELLGERLSLHEVVGEGAFGVVRRATLAPHGKEVAVKMLKDFPSVEEIRSFRTEMELMKSVGAHPHVVSLVGCCSGRRPLLVAEYCSRGDLLSYLRFHWDVMMSKRHAKYYNNNIEPSDYKNDLLKTKQNSSDTVINKMYDLNGVCEAELTSVDLLSFCRQIAMGMEFLASNRVVHRDLAARNVLVSRDRTLKIADFGLSRDVYQDNMYTQKGNGKMPIKWMALESLSQRRYTSQSDVWSFGVVVWEVVTMGGSPYPGVAAARLPRLLRAGYRMPRPPNCSKHLYELMLSCWTARAHERPTFAALHAQLDTLLNGACADQYLTLHRDLLDQHHDHDLLPLAHTRYTYLDIFARAKRAWSRGESYERPSNHYTKPPYSITASPVRRIT